MLKARPGPTIGTRRALLELAGSLGSSGFEPRTDVQDAQPKPRPFANACTFDL